MAPLALLPEEIIHGEILLRIPIESLLRFRFVCKSWFSLIYDRKFTLSHLTRTISQNPKNNYLILKTCKYLPSCPSEATNPKSLSIISRTSLHETHINNVPYLKSSDHDHMCLVGSINGLVCMAFFSDIDHHFILWNPVIRVSKKIVLPGCSLLNIKHYSDLLCGFGWDSDVDDFKISFKCADSSQAFVYSCETNGWNEVVSVPFSSSPCWPKYGSPSVIVKGNPYWEFFKISAILKFEATNNEFTYLKVPSGLQNYSLLNFNDCLARIEYGSLKDKDVYIFEEKSSLYVFDEECSVWSNLYTFNKMLTDYVIENSLWFKNGNEIVNNVYGSMSDVIGSMGYHEYEFHHGFSYTPSLVAIQGMKPLKIGGRKRLLTVNRSFVRIKPFESVSNNYWCATIGHVANDEKTGKVYAEGWKCRCGSLVHCRAPPGKKLGLISKRRTSRLHGRTSTATATASEADKPG